MARKRDLQSLVAKYRLLAEAAEAHEGAFPALARFRVALRTTLKKIAAAKNRQVKLESLRREATRDLWDHVAAGQESSARLKGLVRASFGRNRERLEAFGIKLGGRRPNLYEKKERRNGSPGYH
jgi:hypothetical protein